MDSQDDYAKIIDNPFFSMFAAFFNREIPIKQKISSNEFKDIVADEFQKIIDQHIDKNIQTELADKFKPLFPDGYCYNKLTNDAMKKIMWNVVNDKITSYNSTEEEQREYYENMIDDILSNIQMSIALKETLHIIFENYSTSLLDNQQFHSAIFTKFYSLTDAYELGDFEIDSNTITVEI